MKKRENELEKLISYIGDSVHEVITNDFDEEVDRTSFKTMRDYAPYGNTEVEVCQYVCEEDMEEFRENYEKDTSVDYIIEKLKEDKDFRDCVTELIKYIAWNREMEV